MLKAIVLCARISGAEIHGGEVDVGFTNIGHKHEPCRSPDAEDTGWPSATWQGAQRFFDDANAQQHIEALGYGHPGHAGSSKQGGARIGSTTCNQRENFAGICEAGLLLFSRIVCHAALLPGQSMEWIITSKWETVRILVIFIRGIANYVNKYT